MIRTTLTGRALVGRHLVETLHLGVGVVVSEKREQAGQRQPVFDLASLLVVPAADVDRRTSLGFAQSFERRELGGLVLGDLSRDPVADDDLGRRGQRSRRERHRERSGHVATPAAAQPCPRISAGDQEPDNHVSREVHVDELGPQIRVPKQRRYRLHVDRVAALKPEPGRVLHPRVHRQDHERAGNPREGYRNAAQEMQSRGESVPSVDVDGDEDRLDEEGDPLEREPQAKHIPERRHEAGPQEPHFEAENGSGHDPDGKQGEHRLRPTLGELAVQRITRAQVQPLDHEHERGKGDPKAHERDVHGEGQRLHLAGLQEVVLVHTSEGVGDERDEAGSDHRRRSP